jgi:hypothetical protein
MRPTATLAVNAMKLEKCSLLASAMIMIRFAFSA